MFQLFLRGGDYFHPRSTRWRAFFFSQRKINSNAILNKCCLKTRFEFGWKPRSDVFIKRQLSSVPRRRKSQCSTHMNSHKRAYPASNHLPDTVSGCRFFQRCSALMNMTAQACTTYLLRTVNVSCGSVVYRSVPRWFMGVGRPRNELRSDTQRFYNWTIESLTPSQRWLGNLVQWSNYYILELDYRPERDLIPWWRDPLLSYLLYGEKRYNSASNREMRAGGLVHYITNVWMVMTYSESIDQPSKVANPARRQLNREN